MKNVKTSAKRPADWWTVQHREIPTSQNSIFSYLSFVLWALKFSGRLKYEIKRGH